MSHYDEEREKEVNKGGRPPFVFTEQQIKEVEKLSSVLSKVQLADYYGIAENTFRAAEERQPEVFEAYQKGRSRAIASVAGNLVNQAREGNTSAAIFYLKTQAGWKETQSIESKTTFVEEDEFDW